MVETIGMFFVMTLLAGVAGTGGYLLAKYRTALKIEFPKMMKPEDVDYEAYAIEETPIMYDPHPVKNFILGGKL